MVSILHWDGWATAYSFEVHVACSFILTSLDLTSVLPHTLSSCVKASGPLHHCDDNDQIHKYTATGTEGKFTVLYSL